MVEVSREAPDRSELSMEDIRAMSKSSPVVLGREPSRDGELIDVSKQEGYGRMAPRVIDNGVADFSIRILLVVSFVTAHAFLVRKFVDMRGEFSKVGVGVRDHNPLL